MLVNCSAPTYWITALLFCFSCTKLPAQPVDTDSNQIYLADPAIFHYQNTYYLYGTGAPDGFPVYTSTDLKHWSRHKETNGGYALKKGDAFGSAQFWAPQVFSSNNKFYMAYAANEHIAIASSDGPAGLFSQQKPEPLEAPVKQIDPFVFTDSDGKKYLYHVRLTNGNRIFVAVLTDDLSAIKPETLRECITATEPWENTAHSEWPVAEGPSVLKHNNLYYLVYTTNDFRNPDYAVGYATSSSPYGPWKKYEGNPIISKKNTGQNGTGHGDFIADTPDRLLYVFHTHYSGSKVSPRKTALIRIRFAKDTGSGVDKLVVEWKSFSYLTNK